MAVSGNTNTFGKRQSAYFKAYQSKLQTLRKAYDSYPESEVKESKDIPPPPSPAGFYEFGVKDDAY